MGLADFRLRLISVVFTVLFSSEIKSLLRASSPPRGPTRAPVPGLALLLPAPRCTPSAAGWVFFCMVVKRPGGCQPSFSGVTESPHASSPFPGWERKDLHPYWAAPGEASHGVCPEGPWLRCWGAHSRWDQEGWQGGRAGDGSTPQRRQHGRVWPHGGPPALRQPGNPLSPAIGEPPRCTKARLLQAGSGWTRLCFLARSALAAGPGPPHSDQRCWTQWVLPSQPSC